VYIRPAVREFVRAELAQCTVLVLNGRRRWGKTLAVPDAVCAALDPAWVFLHSVSESGLPMGGDELTELLHRLLVARIPVLIDEFQRSLAVASSVKSLADNLAVRDVFATGHIVLFGSHQVAVLRAGLGVLYSCHRVRVATFPAPSLSLLLSFAKDRGLDMRDFLKAIAAVDSNLEAFGLPGEAERHLEKLTNAESILQNGNLPDVDWLLDPEYKQALAQALLGSAANPKITDDLHRLGFLKRGPKGYYEAHDPVLRSTKILTNVTDWKTQEGNLCGKALEWLLEATELQQQLQRKLGIPDGYTFSSGTMGRRQAEIDGLWLPPDPSTPGARVVLLSCKRAAEAQYSGQALALHLARLLHSEEYSKWGTTPFLLVALSGDGQAEVARVKASNNDWQQFLSSDQPLKGLKLPKSFPNDVDFQSFSLQTLLQEYSLFTLEEAAVVQG
jgi:hypothetical protein